MTGFTTLYVPLKQEIVLKYLKIKYERVEPCSFTFSGRQFKVTASIDCVHQVVLQDDPNVHKDRLRLTEKHCIRA